MLTLNGIMCLAIISFTKSLNINALYDKDCCAHHPKRTQKNPIEEIVR